MSMFSAYERERERVYRCRDRIEGVGERILGGWNTRGIAI